MEDPIITADDFGVSGEVNQAIVEALECGLATHASLVTNTGSFEQACSVAHEQSLTDRLGVHLVLTEGVPLTEPIRACRRFCDDNGEFRYWRSTNHAVRLAPFEREAVLAEVRAQVSRCLEHGIRPTHLDSHHHVHNKLAISRIVVAVAKEFQIRRIRVAHNCGPRVGVANRVYKSG